MSMDREISRKRWTLRRIAGTAAAVVAIGVSVSALLEDSGLSKLRVEREALTVSTVELGPFQEYTAVRGTVLPRYTVYLDALEGGTVDTLYVDVGAGVASGDPILQLRNPDTELAVYNQEAAVAGQLDELRRGQLNTRQRILTSRQTMMQAEHDARGKERRYARYRSVHDTVRLTILARQEWERIEDEYTYARARLELERERHRQDSLLATLQLQALERAVETTERNLEVMRQRLANLTLRAPIGGQLSALDAVPGQRLSTGTRLGMIDVLEDLTIRAEIDEYHIARVRRGQPGTCLQDGEELPLTTRKVYPEVVGGRFAVELDFVGSVPAGMRRGQTVRVRLQLGDVEEAVQVARGAFYQTTGGHWVYVVATDHSRAVRRSIRLGRQNPRVFEVLAGLEPGDEVITSSYDSFGADIDVLVLR